MAQPAAEADAGDMWGFYPDSVNPHRVGFLTVLWPCDYTYWVEPTWMRQYASLAATFTGLGYGAPPDPAPPAQLVVPAGPGRPDSWPPERHARAKVVCWQLTGNGWSTSRRLLLANGEVEGLLP